MDRNKVEQMIQQHQKQSRKTYTQMKIVFSLILVSYVMFMIQWYGFTH